MAQSKLADVHVGDIGTEFRGRLLDVATPYDPTLATSKTLRFSPPSGDVIEVDADVDHVGDDFFLRKITSDSTLAASEGIWKYQGRVVMPDGKTFTTSEVWYRVVGNL